MRDKLLKRKNIISGNFATQFVDERVRDYSGRYFYGPRNADVKVEISSELVHHKRHGIVHHGKDEPKTRGYQHPSSKLGVPGKGLGNKRYNFEENL